MKDPYIFDFITTRENMIERDIENELVKNITKLLLELGSGFAFIGSQYHLTVGGKDYYIDLLFYHLNLRCYVVIELKMGEFEPEHAGKLNFYLSAVDDKLKKKTDNPSIKSWTMSCFPRPSTQPDRGRPETRIASRE